MQIATVGLDLAKNVFQLHGVDAAGRSRGRRRLRRSEVMQSLHGHAPCLVGMEACAGAHHWARLLASLGHEVRLMPPAYVKAYVRRQKNDMADAAAICEAVTRPSMRFVPVKSEEQQALLLLHRARDLLVRQRTSLINALRAHLAEFGVVLPKGAPHGRRLASMLIDGETFGLPASAAPALQMLARQCQALSGQIAELERSCGSAPCRTRRPAVCCRCRASARSPPPPERDGRRSRRASSRRASSQPGSAWCRGSTRPAATSGSVGSPRWATPTCADC